LGPEPISEKILAEKKEQYPQRITVPNIGIDAPIIFPESKNEYVLQKALEQGVIYWPDSSLSNEKGMTIIIGHSSAFPWYQGQYGSIFSLLNHLEQGSEIFLFSNKEKYIYQVIEKDIKAPKNLNFKAEEEKSVLYLVSCWPINTDWKRIIIKAIKVDTE